MKTREEIIAQVNSLLAEEFEIEESEFAPDANLKETLNLDSINLVDLIALVQFTYKITIPVEDLKKIQCPVLVIGSKQDHVFNWERIKQTADVLGCESYFYEEYSHCVYDEAPDYKARLKAFFG